MDGLPGEPAGRHPGAGQARALALPGVFVGQPRLAALRGWVPVFQPGLARCWHRGQYRFPVGSGRQRGGNEAVRKAGFGPAGKPVPLTARPGRSEQLFRLDLAGRRWRLNYR